jgi:AAA15 family ATPase/GTPase
MSYAILWEHTNASWRLAVFKTINISNFRCFDDFSVNNLTRINLIAGKNSVGKTAFLEAIYLLIGAGNIALTIKLSTFRGIHEFRGDFSSISELLWMPLFNNFDDKKDIFITGETTNNKGRYAVKLAIKSADAQKIYFENRVSESADFGKKLTLKYKGLDNQDAEYEMSWINGDLKIRPVPLTPPFPGYFYSTKTQPHEEDAGLFGNLVKTKRPFDLVKILKSVEDRLINLTTIQSAGIPTIYGDIGLEQLLPISLMGDGVGRLTSILLRIANSVGGVVLIDEIENGFHYSILKDVWKAIGEAAKAFNTQLFITTHSYEAIKKASEVFANNRDFSFHRIDRIHEKIESIDYKSEELATALESDFEVR